MKYSSSLTEKEVKDACREIANRHWVNEKAIAELKENGFSANVTYDQTGRMYMGMVHTHKHGVVIF